MTAAELILEKNKRENGWLGQDNILKAMEEYGKLCFIASREKEWRSSPDYTKAFINNTEPDKRDGAMFHKFKDYDDFSATKNKP